MKIEDMVAYLTRVFVDTANTLKAAASSI